MRKRIIVLFMALILSASAALASPQAEASPENNGGFADLILHNGFVYTMVPQPGDVYDWQYSFPHPPADSPDQVAQAVAIRGDKIIYVGENGPVNEFKGPNTKVIDLNGRMLMPGLIDGHSHALNGGESLTAYSLGYFVPLKLEEVLESIQGFLDESADKEPDGWLNVKGLDYGSMRPAGTELYNTDLDTLDTDRPIVVDISISHMCIVNSRALELAGIDASTPDPEGGVIGHFPNGEPNGHLSDAAGWMVTALIPPKTLDEKMEDAKAAQAALLAQGVTEVTDAASNEEILQVWRALEEAGELKMRTHHFPPANQELDVDDMVAELQALKETFQSPKVRVEAAKYFLDGLKAYPVQTGWLLEPYLVNVGTEDEPDWQPGDLYGETYWETNDLKAAVAAFNKAGWQNHFHSVGDAAARQALDALQYSRNQNGWTDTRDTIVHIDMCDPVDWPRFHQLGVIGSMSLQWAKRDSMSVEGEENYLGLERIGRIYPTRGLIENNALVAAGSDWPVDPLDEWLAIEMGVTRINDEGALHYQYPVNAHGVPIEQVLRMNTINSAYQFKQENEVGTLEVGKLANMIVLNQNVLEVPADQISETEVIMTIIEGEIVFER